MTMINLKWKDATLKEIKSESIPHYTHVFDRNKCKYSRKYIDIEGNKRCKFCKQLIK